MASDPQTSIVLGIVTGAHGVSGRVKVKPFTEVPEGVAEHGPVLINGETRKIKVTSRFASAWPCQQSVWDVIFRIGTLAGIEEAGRRGAGIGSRVC